MTTQDTQSEMQNDGFEGFTETFVHSLDGKKRVTIPSTWRDKLGRRGCVFVMPDLHEPCLRVFPPSEWNRRLQTVRRRAMSDRTAREFARELGRQSQRVEWDAQGRIRIRDELLAFAGLVDQVVMLGTCDTLEFWAPGTKGAETGIDQAKLRDTAAHIDF
jgi:division/cell wall cluster transcriptional repressor MraZ